MTCGARWAFQYGGQLTDGTTLRSRRIAPILSEGRAWGAAVAQWHANCEHVLASWYAHQAMLEALEADREEMLRAGIVVDPEQYVQMTDRLGAMLDHYMATTTPLRGLTLLEHQTVVPVPSRDKPGRASNLYRFQCFIDGYTEQYEPDGSRWLVEFKLRNQLEPVAFLQLGRQYRWYAWAHAHTQRGVTPAGVIIDQRWNELPREPRILKNGKASHDQRQLITEPDYLKVCEATGEDPSEDVLAKLKAIRWQQRVPILFRPGELVEAGRELTAAGMMIHDLDAGVLYPIRNASMANCRNCRFNEICAAPDDTLFVDTLIERGTPKRLLGDLALAA
jgi:hypothetical protein